MTRFRPSFSALILTVAITLPAIAAEGPTAARAIELYDAGRYPEARQVLEQLETAGKATGPLLYRLYFAQRAGGDAATGQQTLQRATETLEEAASATDLETHFYLVNALQSLGRTADMTRAAAAAVAKADQGQLDAETALDKFRLGKLYADLERKIEASDWFAQAVAGFEKDPAAHDAYFRWASRYLADQALAGEDHPAAEQYLTLLAEHGELSGDDLDRLAVLRVRIELYEQAAEAWSRAARANPASANRANYCSRLARMAAGIGTLPATAPAGSPWSSLAKEDLEQLLKEQAGTVRRVRDEAEQAREAGTLDDPTRQKLLGELEEAKAHFVAAGLEYAIQGNSIREAAFFGGYSPLIFHSREWRLLQPQPRQRDARPENVYPGVKGPKRKPKEAG